MGNALKVVAKVCVGEPSPPREEGGEACGWALGSGDAQLFPYIFVWRRGRARIPAALRHCIVGVAHLIPLLFWHVSTDKGKGRREGGRRRKEGRPRDGANPRHLSAEYCIRFLCHEADVFLNHTCTSELNKRTFWYFGPKTGENNNNNNNFLFVAILRC